ncbi:patatin-like phospholipase family protein [Streptococcus gallinaceus]|uniref:Patatin/cPLA2 family phospholipase n=1 Tax=Streptococcus gallinaceus TaxID=165758 RepID=A0ABV2JM74_9STRE|nr:patatin family protein [Streptococcus gallinaceus]MCP1639535.1 putative patatin/cPLA2 family phospholipase [Streptococcus gallinaceus]MCP1770318.1 putative patatin/cPLA2 family phospholipase [Streptococcus gallinaceus]
MRVGLVLEGGGMRGLYTAGVLDAFLDAGIKVDGLVGVSAGALFGVNFVSGQRGRALRYNKKYISYPNYMSFGSWLKTGNMVNKDFTYYEIPMKLDVFDEQAFEQSGVDFYAVATEMSSGQPAYFKIDNVFEQMEIFRASSALPIVSKMVEWQGKQYLDGGLSDSIPVEFARSLGFDKLIVVLTQPKEYRKKPSSGRAYKLLYRKYPNFVKVASMRYKHYNQAVERVIELEEAGELFVFRPQEKLKIGRLEKDLDKLQEIYDRGLEDTRDRLPDLEKYLAN